LPERLKTKNGRIELAPALFVDEVQQLGKRLDQRPGADTLLLIGRRHLRSNNSWMHNCRRLMGGKERCTLLMHPDDAARLGFDHGQRAAVSSRTGRIEVKVELSDEVMPGVVSLPHGWGHHRSGTRLGAAADRPGASANDLTDDRAVDSSCGNAVLNGVPVRVAPIQKPG
jgi:anaerobic selenocysteine-containing dehydrogenase